MKNNDYARIQQIVLNINELAQKIGIELTVEAYDDVIVELNNALLSYGYLIIAGEKTTKFKENEQIVYDSNDLEIMYFLCRDVPGVDVRRFGQKVIESGNPEYNFLFERDIKGSDKEAHDLAIIKSKDPKYNLLSALLRKKHIKEKEEVILNSRSAEYNYLYEHNVEGADVEAHKQVILESNDEMYNDLLTLEEKGTIKK